MLGVSRFPETHRDLDLHVGEVVVEVLLPVLDAPVEMAKDQLDGEKIGKRIADDLVDDVGDETKTAQTNVIRIGSELVVDSQKSQINPLSNEVVELLAEDDRSMSVRFKVDTDVALARLVMQMLHSGGHTSRLHSLKQCFHNDT